MPFAYSIALLFTWLLSLLIATIPSYWLLIHPFAAWWRRRPDWILRVTALMWVLLWIVAALATYRLGRTLYVTPWSWVGGAILWVAGFALHRPARRDFTPTQLLGISELRPATHEQRLVTAGIRSRIRHPIYAGQLCVLVGTCIASGMLANYVLLAWYLLTLPVMLHFEDRELVARFGGAYRDYKQRVPAIIPRLG